jgi:hypothetical protein
MYKNIKGYRFMKILLLVLVAVLLAEHHALAQEDLAKQSQNPVANMISVPFENNTYFDVGPSEKWANALFVKPVYPLSLGKLNLINRLIVPVIYLKGQDSISRESDDDPVLGKIQVFPGSSNKFGLGNIQYQAFISPANPGKVTWGLGPAFEFPTNTNSRLGTDTWSIGPTMVVLTMPGNWVLGFVTQNIWDFAGKSGEPNVSRFTFQPILNYMLGQGWYLTSSPMIAANWEASSGEKWTVPVGGGGGRLMRFGKQPIDFKLASYWYADAPEFGPDWSLQFTVKFLFPKT